MIDWHLVTEIVVPIGTLFLGAWLNRKVERKPNIVTYLGHTGAFKHTLADGKKMDVYTHSVVISNNGQKTATNVRLRHHILPDFDISPSVDYQVKELPDGGTEIVIPLMVPKQQLTVSYLYFPPVTWDKVNAGILSDEGFATAIPVLIQRQYSRLFNVSVGLLMLVGLATVVYLAVLGVRRLLGS